MVVQHNLTAMNSNRMLGITQGAQAKSSEKLSSGYRINRAADDAAGLSISEKMRKQINGLDRASTNAEDGVSAVQTAEGALTEVHSMLQRMNELAVQSANGTNSQTDRDAIQAEIDQLIDEIDRVAETTKFNETYLLKGDETAAAKDIYSYKEVEITQTAAAGLAYNAAGMTAVSGKTLYSAANTAIDEADYANYFDVAEDGTVSLKANVTVYTDAAGSTALTAADISTYVTGSAESYTGTYAGLYAEDGTTELTEDEAKAAIKNGDTLYTNAAGNEVAKLYDGNGDEIAAEALAEKLADGDVYDSADAATRNAVTDLSAYTDKTTVNGDLQLNLHVGADSADTNKIGLAIKSMSAAGIGVNGLKVDSEDSATNAIDTISAAIQKVSEQRSELGAVQNRLEHTIANLDNVVENTTAAESRIRDTDMAEEMVEYSKNNILAQAGQSMLAQANTATQGVLSLLG